VHVRPEAPEPDLRAIMAAHKWTSLIIKPCVSGGSRASVRVHGGDDAALARAQRFLHDMLTVGYDTSQVGAAAAAAGGSGAAAAPAAAAVAEDGVHPKLHHMPSHRSMKLLSAEEAAAEAAAAATAAAAAYIPPSAAHETRGEWAGPCEMMIQPYIPSVETAGELSVIVVDGVIQHAITKVPQRGDFRTQDEYGGLHTVAHLSVPDTALVHRVLDAAVNVVERFQAPATPSTPAGGVTTDRVPLPPDALLLARVDFLPLTKEAYAQAFPDGASGAVPRTVSDGGDESPIALVSHDSTLLLLELEVIEPSMFLRHRPATAEALAEAIVSRLTTLRATPRRVASAKRAAAAGSGRLPAGVDAYAGVVASPK